MIHSRRGAAPSKSCFVTFEGTISTNIRATEIHRQASVACRIRFEERAGPFARGVSSHVLSDSVVSQGTFKSLAASGASQALRTCLFFIFCVAYRSRGVMEKMGRKCGSGVLKYLSMMKLGSQVHVSTM